jgi:hypothetical protein
LFDPESWFEKYPVCGVNPKVDYEIRKQFGYDPLSGDWGFIKNHIYLYNDFCYDTTFGIGKIVNTILGDD